MSSRTKRAVALGIGLGLLSVLAGTTACSEKSSPTEPRAAAGATAEVETPVARMPVVLVTRLERSTPGTPGPTRTPTPTSAVPPTATPLPTTVPPTPTPAFTVVQLRAVSWEWDFYGPNASLGLPYPGFNTLTVKKGNTYELHIYNGGPVPDPGINPHVFSGVPGLGLSAATLVSLDGGGSEIVERFTPTTTGTYIYNCGDTACSTGDISRQHDQMFGMIIVTN